MEKIKILLVEDHLIVQKLAGIMFGQLNCTVDIAGDGAIALAKCRQQIYDLIIMDIGLPDADGFSMTKRIRQEDKNNRNTPVVALTAHAEEEVKEQIKESGMKGFFSKPIMPGLAEKILGFVKS